MDAVPFFHKCFIRNIVDTDRHLVEHHRAAIIICVFRQETPDFFRSEWDERCKDHIQTTQDGIDCCLCRAADERAGRFHIEPILDDIQIEIGHVNRAEVVQRVIDNMEFEPVITARCCFDQLVKPRQCPFIQICELVNRHHILVWIKVKKVAKDITCGVADFTVNLRELLQNIVRNADIRMVIRRSNPQTQNICTVFVVDLARLDPVAQRFRLFAAIAVNHPSMGTDRLVRGFSLPRN